jgi:hypothetical protein
MLSLIAYGRPRGMYSLSTWGNLVTIEYYCAAYHTISYKTSIIICVFPTPLEAIVTNEMTFLTAYKPVFCPMRSLRKTRPSQELQLVGFTQHTVHNGISAASETDTILVSYYRR